MQLIKECFRIVFARISSWSVLANETLAGIHSRIFIPIIFRTRSPTTRDRDRQCQGEVSAGCFEFSQVDYFLSLQVDCAVSLRA